MNWNEKLKQLTGVGWECNQMEQWKQGSVQYFGESPGSKNTSSIQ